MIQRDLIGTNLLINQKRGMAFNLDTILLADFVKISPKCEKVIDFGTGNGALLLYLSQKTKATLVGLEIQPNRVELAKQNVLLNGLNDQIEIIQQDIKTFKVDGFVDVIVSNPPFFKINEQTKRNITIDETIARHEVELTLEQLINSISRMLNNNGIAFLIHRPERLTEITQLLKEHKMSLTTIRFVHPTSTQVANHVLIEAKKTKKSELKVLPPLILYQAPGTYSDELKKIYGGRSYVTTNIR